MAGTPRQRTVPPRAQRAERMPGHLPTRRRGDRLPTDRPVAVRMAWADLLKANLLDILRFVNDWLKYAETKNAGLVGLASAAAAGTLAYLSDRGGSAPMVVVGVALAELCFVASLLVGIASFLPQTDLGRTLDRRLGAPTGADNLYFYGDLAKYAPRPLAEAIARRYVRPGPEPTAIHDDHLDLAAQIVTNARITLWKLRLFAFAVALFALAVLIFTVVLTVSALL